MRIFKRPFLVYFPAAAVLIIISIAVFFYRKSPYEGRLYCGTESEINIGRDNNGTPFVKAKTFNDAYFAIGFLHGQDRLALMEYFRAIASGRLSVLTGDNGLFLDKLSLTLGIARNAEALAGKLKSPYKEYLNSYVKGVNASIKKFYNISDLKTDEWTDKDVVSILLLFDWADSFLNNRELVFPLTDKLNTEAIKNIIPDELLYQYSDQEMKNTAILVKIRNIVSKQIGPFQDGFAFYIRNEKMQDGKAATGFTLDGEMTIYPKWYPLSIIVGNKRIDGVTASGLPFIFFGMNGNITFAGFNLGVDTQDFYREQTRIINNTRKYYRNGTWKEFILNDEKIFSKGKQRMENELLSVRATDIGPVLSDLSEEENGECISVSSIMPDESYINSLFEIPVADSVVSARKSIQNIFSLPRIYLFTDGTGAEFAFSGKTMVRNLMTPLFDGAFFKGIFAFDISGYSRAIAGDSIIIGNKMYDSIPEVLAAGIFPRDLNRYNKLKELIGKKSLLNSKDVVQILSNTRSVIAEKVTPYFLSTLKYIPVPSSKLCQIYFSDWDYNMNSGSIAATVFNNLFINMIEETISDETGTSAPVIMDKYYLLEDKFTVLLGTNSNLFDDISTENTETRDKIFDRAFFKTLRHLNKNYGPKMENWGWGRVHTGHFITPFAKCPFFNHKPGSIEDSSVPGDNTSVKKGGINAVNLLKPSCISVTSVIFYLDYNLSFYNFQVSPTLDTGSEYFKNYKEAGNFVSFDSADMRRSFLLLPYKK